MVVGRMVFWRKKLTPSNFQLLQHNRPLAAVSDRSKAASLFDHLVGNGEQARCRANRRRDDPNSTFAVSKRTAKVSVAALIMRAVARPYQTGSDEAA
jgi:hypothetical protein